MPLRRLIKDKTGQDVYKCQACMDCDIEIRDEMDVPLASLIALVLLDDDEALHSRTLWSDSVLEAARSACKRGLDLHAVILALRGESLRKMGGSAAQ